MTESKTIRIDKFLWAVRIYKTRSIASDACRKGRIIVGDIQVKPSRIIISGEKIIVRKPPVNYTFRVIEPIENRVSAKVLDKYIEDLTSDEEKLKLDFKNTGYITRREKGTGRPTKKERRDLDSFFDDLETT